MKYKLGEIFEVGSGGTPSKSHPEYYGGSIPWIKTGDLKCEYLYEAEDYITEEGLNNSSAKMYPPDTVLIAMYGATIGATSILKIDACTNQACATFKKNEKVIPEYLYYFFKSQKKRFVKDGVGGAQPNISAGYLKNVEMEVPTLERQSEIVGILDKVNRVIEQRRMELEEADSLIKSRFVELFGNGRDGICDMKMLGAFCKFQQGTQVPVEEQIEEQLDGYTRFLRIVDYTQAPQPPRYVSVRGREVEENSVVIVRYGATAGFVGHGYAGILANNLFEIVPNEEVLSKDFLYLALKYGTFEQEIHDKVFGAAMPALSFGMMNDISVVTPSSNEQNYFVEFVHQIDKLKFEVRKSLDKTQILMDSLMQKYFG